MTTRRVLALLTPILLAVTASLAGLGKLGDYYQLQAMRKDLRGFKPGPFLYFWNARLAK